MDLSLPLQILGALLAIFFIVTLVMGAKTWKWFHITCAFFVFCAAGTFVAYAAMSLKTRTVWVAIAEKYEADYLKADREATILRDGDETKPEEYQYNTVRGLNDELKKLYLHRGRVWRNCALAEINQAQARLKFTTQGVSAPAVPAAPGVPAAEGAPAAAPEANRIEVKSILYLFKDRVVDNVHRPGEQRLVPANFVGEVTVVEVTDNDVTVTPTLPFDGQQASHLAIDPNTSWTIYEMMPIDTHEALQGLTEAQIQAIMPNDLQIPPADYQELIAQFVRDGQAPLESDPPERRWVRVKFLQKQTVVVDSPTTAIEKDSKYYDEEGRALLTELRAEKPVEFEKGQEAVFNQEKADQLIADGICEKIADIYRRPLNDFAHHFHEIHQRVGYLNDRIQEVQRQTAVLIEAKDKVAKQIEYRTKEKSQLEQDLAKFREEQARIVAYRKRLEATIEETVNQIAAADKQCQDLVDELTEMQRRMAAEINSRTLPAPPGATKPPPLTPEAGATTSVPARRTSDEPNLNGPASVARSTTATSTAADASAPR